MNYLDLFSGCGGFRLALAKNHITPEYEAHSEIDKYASKIYARHFPKSEALGDVRTIKSSDGTINGHKIHLITFGFPCQDLSLAGKRAGLEGSRSGLFYEATRLIKELKPEVFIFENVKGLFTSQAGADFTTILREITDIGLYECQWQMLNTRWFLPQNRERIFFIGFIAKSTRGRKQIFPFSETCGLHHATKGNEIQQIAATFIARQYASGRGNYLKQINPPTAQANRVYDACGIANSLSALGGGMGAKTGLYTIPVITPDRPEKRQSGRRMKKDGEPSFTLTAQDKHGIYDGHKIRKLTPIECERLQGFPDNWTDGTSDSQRYKMLGNAVTADVAAEIFKRIYRNSL